MGVLFGLVETEMVPPRLSFRLDSLSYPSRRGNVRAVYQKELFGVLYIMYKL